ncbi:dermonecrotic toxin domain-containing protein [Pseudomonas sp. NFX5]|uniref:dermonecrotic toxin domain-containing protein n=1 Tax=Pseudomonas sp. NFX5 TaxID=2816961 RepID=UPI003B8E91BB
MTIMSQPVTVQPQPATTRSSASAQDGEPSVQGRTKRSLIQTVTQWPVNPPPSPRDPHFQHTLEQSKQLLHKSDKEMASQYCAALMLLESRKGSVPKTADQPPTVTDIPPFSTFGQAWALFTLALKQEPFASYAKNHNIDISSLRWFPHADSMECTINGKVQLFSRNTPGWREASAAVAAAAKEVAAGRVESFPYTGEHSAPIDVVGNFYGEEPVNRQFDLLSSIRSLQGGTFKSLMPHNGPLAPQFMRVRKAQGEVENAIATATYNETRGVADANRTPTISQRVEEADRELARDVSRWVGVKATGGQNEATELTVSDLPKDSSYMQAVQAYKEALSSDTFKKFMQTHCVDPRTVEIDNKGTLFCKIRSSDGSFKWIHFPVKNRHWKPIQDDILKAAREIRGSSSQRLQNYNYVRENLPMAGILDFYGVREHYGSPQWLEQSAALIRDGFPALDKDNPPNDPLSLAVREHQQAAKQRLARTEGLPPPSFPVPTTPFRRNQIDAAIPTPAKPSAQPVTPADIIGQRLFGGEPNRQTVVAGLLKDAISTASPSLNVDVQQLAFAAPDPQNPGQFLETPLMELALNHIAGADAPVFSHDGKFVDTRANAQALTGNPPGTALNIDRSALQTAISQLPGKLDEAMQAARLDYWGKPPFNEPAPGVGADASIFGGDRRLMLGELMRSNLLLASMKHPGLNDMQRETLDLVARYPHGSTRPKLADSSVTVFAFSSTDNARPDTPQSLTPNLVIERMYPGRTLVLVCEPSGKVTPYNSLNAAKQAWEGNLKIQQPNATFSTEVTKVDADAFYIQASNLINRNNADAVTTYPALLSSQPSDAAAEKVSDWIKNTTDVNRFMLYELTTELAGYMHRNKEQTYNSGIPDLHTYIQDQVKALSPPPFTCDIDDVEVHYSTNLAYLTTPLVRQKSGKMSLTEAFMQNLAQFMFTEVEVRNKTTGALIPALSNRDAFDTLIAGIDVGKNYPELLKKELLDDPTKKTERQQRYGQQVPIELKIKALELTAKGESGFDNAMGFRYLQAILDPTPGNKTVDGKEITMRPLAFVRQPGSSPDVVENMFLIEPKDSTQGPHILYRPLMNDAPLLQFPSRQALMEAIQKPGKLQTDIIAWLPDESSRTVYRHGGFSEPHLPANRVFFSDFNALRKPDAPTIATAGTAMDDLQTKLQSGQLMNYLYEANAKAMISLQEQHTVSDSESRWATLKEGGFMVLSAVLPVLRGPAAVLGMAMQLYGVLGDLETLTNEEEGKKGDKLTAAADLLVNFAMLLFLHRAAGSRSAARSNSSSAVGMLPENSGRPPLTDNAFVSGGRIEPPTTVVENNRVPTTEVTTSTATDGTQYRPVIEAFEKDGLLIRTLQLRNAHLEFHNTGETLDNIRAQGDANRGHGGLRKWSLAQADLLPNYYKMGDNAGALPRNMAILAFPEKLQNNITAIHEKDAFSGNIQADTRYMGQENARKGMQDLLTELKTQQGEHPDNPLENSEIQTVGVPPDALAGLVFYGSNGQTWEAAKPQFQRAINRAGPEFDGKSYPVFTYKVEEGKTRLVYLETLKVDTKAS